MSTNKLRHELVNLGVDINRQIDVIIATAKDLETSPHEMRHSDGSWVLPPLLLAKSQVLNGLAVLELKEKD